MSQLYVAIDAVAPVLGGLIVSGAAPIAAKAVTLTERALGEMAGEASIGEVVDLQLTRGSLFVRARLATGIALLKVRERVLNTIAIIGTLAGDELRVERVSLCDRPGALEKRAGGPVGGPLAFAKGLKMRIARIELGEPLRLNSAPPDLAKSRELAARDEDAVTMIRNALKFQVKPANDAAFLAWYAARSGQ